MAQATSATKSKRNEKALAITYFVLITVAFTFVFGPMFDSYAVGLGPAIAVAIAVFGTTLRKAWRKDA